jgi:DNA mismatch endonuclease (patch repair protein)
MSDTPRRPARDPAVTSKIMSAVRSKNTKPELALRRAVHAHGGRFRIHARDIPGRPDIVVRSRKLAIFIDGDLWHGNPDEWHRRGRSSLADLFPNRTAWWVAKIERNIERDREVDQQLVQAGWRVIRLWASDVMADLDSATSRVMTELRHQP